MEALISTIGDALILCVAALDALPDGIRALLCALLMVPLLRYFEGQIEVSETRFAEAFRKAALLALLFIPLFVFFFPGSRMVVYTPELPSLNAPTRVFWSVVLGLWATGAIASVLFLLRSYLTQRPAAFANADIADDEKLINRLNHWHRRLGLSRTPALSFIAGPRPLHDSWLSGFRHARIGLPKAAAHFPASVQDQLLIQELCHLKKRHAGWHALGQVVSCLYWPFTWVQQLHERLLTNLNLSADELAASCYRDPMGYTRACKQVQERLAPPAGKRVSDGLESQADASWLPQRLRQMRSYGHRLGELRQPDPFLQWNLQELSLARAEVATDERHTDPYTRVVVAVGEAAFLAFLLTGTTLLPTPPKVDIDELRWQYRFIDGFHRALERSDATSLQNPAGAAEKRREEPVAIPKPSG